MGIIAATPFEQIARRISLYWVSQPVILRTKENHGQHDRQCGTGHARQKTCPKTRPDRDHRGVPIGVAGSTNMMKIHRVGEIKGLEPQKKDTNPTNLTNRQSCE